MALSKIEILKERRQAIEQAQTEAVQEFKEKLSPLISDYRELKESGVLEVWADCASELERLGLTPVAAVTKPAKQIKAKTDTVRIRLTAIVAALGECKTAATADELQATEKLNKYTVGQVQSRLEALVANGDLKEKGGKFSVAPKAA